MEFDPYKTIHIKPVKTFTVKATIVPWKKGTIKHLDRTRIVRDDEEEDKEDVHEM